MNKMLSFFKGEYFKKKITPEIKRFLAVSVFTLIYGVGVSWFLDSTSGGTGGVGNPEGIRLYTGGMPGLAQLIVDMTFVFSDGRIILDSFFMGVFIILANIPILLLGWFKVSKKFTIYSLISVIIQSTVIGFIPTPKNIGLQELDPLVSGIVGGLLIGVGVGGALKHGTSTGGLDIVSQYYSLKSGKSVGVISMALNLSIAFAGGLLISSIATIAYSLIRLLVSTVATDKVHTSYQFISCEVITSEPKDLIDEILSNLYRGVTTIKAEGAFSKNEKTIIYVVIASYELSALIIMVKHTDPNAFLVTKPVKNVYGNFKRKTIA